MSLPVTDILWHTRVPYMHMRAWATLELTACVHQVSFELYCRL